MNEMEQNQSISHVNVEELEAGTHVQGYYILQGASHRTTLSGKPFLSANVTDKSGSAPVIFWDYRGPVGPTCDGQVVSIRGQVAEFKGALQITLEHIHVAAPEENPDVSCLVPVAPIDKEAMKEQVLKLVESVADPHYQAVAQEFLNRHMEAFCTIPAAKSVHHSFLNGLLMHTGKANCTTENDIPDIKLPGNLSFLLNIFTQNSDTPLKIEDILFFYKKEGKQMTENSLKVLISNLRKEIRNNKDCNFIISNNKGVYALTRLRES